MATEWERNEQLKKMRSRPAAPGEVLADLADCNGLTQSELAQRLGVGRQTVSQLIRGKRTFTLDIAHRLGRLFGNGPALWLNLQKQVELWDALHAKTDAYDFIEPLQNAA